MPIAAMVEKPAPRSYKHNAQRLTPKNGRYLVCMLAGGPADRARELRDLLAERRGLLAKYHRDYEQPKSFGRPLPKDLDFIIVIKSQLGHALEAQVVKAAKAAGIPVVRTSHKWSAMNLTLRMRFDIGKAAPLPLNVSSVAYLREDDGQPLPVELPPEPVPQVLQPEPPPIDELRKAVLEKDTMMLVRELQARLGSLGVTAVLVEPTQVTFQTEKK